MCVDTTFFAIKQAIKTKGKFTILNCSQVFIIK